MTGPINSMTQEKDEPPVVSIPLQAKPSLRTRCNLNSTEYHRILAVSAAEIESSNRNKISHEVS